MNKLYKLSVTILLIVSSISVYAQVNIEISDKQIFVLGKKYYLHEVLKGQTLYSICKAYGVTENEVLSENSQIAVEGLKSGTEIKIPASKNNINYNETKEEEFVYHTVERKQTLYFLTQKYSISESDIVRLNPQIRDGLKTGQVLKIPKPGSVKVSSDGDYRFHTVQPGETLFSLAQQYGIDIGVLKMDNPDLGDGGPRIGQVLRIPTKSRSFEEILVINHEKNYNPSLSDYDPLYFEEDGVTPCNSFKYNSSMKFKVAVLLPFFLQENNALKTTGKYYKNTERFFEFYQGLLLAAKKMKELGVSIEFYIKDTKANSQRVAEILSLSEMRDMDLIIGPVYSDNFRLASTFAQENKINIVSPFKLKNEEMVVSNPFVFLANPSDETEVANISSYLSKSYDRSIVLLHNGTPEEEQMIDLYKRNLVKSFATNQNINEIVFKQVNFKTGGAPAVEDALSVGLENIVIIPSSDQVFITNVVTKLNYLTGKYKITLYGMSPWEQFRNIEIEYLRNLKFHYGTTAFIDHENKTVKNFDYSYETYFKTGPSIFSYLGYDISYFFINVMKDYGKHFQFCLHNSENNNYSSGLRFDFNFERASPFSGFENNWLRIVKIDNDLNIVKVK